MNLPKIKDNLLVQDLAGEVLIYDQTTNKSYCLNETAKTVFNACDGVKTFADLKLPEDIIYLSLDELKKQNLIQSDYVSPFVGMNRREVVKRIGLASLIALPVISSLIAPTSASAASGRGTAGYFQPCQTTNDCAGTNTCQTSNNAQGGSSRVCCNTRFGDFNRTGPGVPAGILIFGNCGSCGSIDPVQEDTCCSQFRRYSGTCTPNGDGTVNCSYVCS